MSYHQIWCAISMTSYYSLMLNLRNQLPHSLTVCYINIKQTSNRPWDISQIYSTYQDLLIPCVSVQHGYMSLQSLLLPWQADTLNGPDRCAAVQMLGTLQAEWIFFLYTC
jgi:hypothetical protein